MKRSELIVAAALAVGVAAGTCLAADGRADAFRVGFARVDVTPPNGAAMPGYFAERLAEGAATPLEAECLAFDDGKSTAFVMSVDNLHLSVRDVTAAQEAVFARLKVPAERIFIASTHTHTGAATDLTYNRNIKDPEGRRLVELYGKFLTTRLADLAAAAADDLRPATLAVARTQCPNLSFVRRFRMKDGSVRTNPPASQAERPLGTSDDTLQLVRISRADAPDIALVNFQCHPDTVGGNLYHADWPGVLRHTFESALADGTHCFFLNGAQGDVNHHWRLGVTPERKALLAKGRKMISVHMGRALAGAALGLWDTCVPFAAGAVRGAVTQARVPSNRPTPDEIRWIRLADEGRADEIPLTGMERTTLLSATGRARSLMNGPDFFDMPVSSVAIGGALAFAGFPGEPFTEIGRAVKARSPFAVTLVGCLVNGSFGYFPTTGAYAEGGYEVCSSKFAPAVGDTLIRTQLEQLENLHGKDR